MERERSSPARNMSSSSQKRSVVFATRDFPSGCGTHIDPCKIPRLGDDDDVSDNHPRVAAPESKQQPAGHHVAASSSSHRREMETRRSSDSDPTPRERVLEVLSLFQKVYRQLDQDKKARRGGDQLDATSRIDIKTLNVLENMGKQLNTEKRIGSVPGINVGDEFQYKTELRVVGLHSKTMHGIDYLKIGDLRLATSIVASEGYGYIDTFNSGVMFYTGEGGNVMSKEKKTENQKLTKGNLALANSMSHKTEVRVIRGEERWDRKGKRYVYDGLYLVEQYGEEREARGKLVYKFKLCRIPGQPPLT
ncbi:PREDICTED: YDG domain-containing protein At5g47150-like [Camelina sativa]|uniref:YDG domain-containing protein At5g47150-like n=1 Tax=Camelina sativa TaxID=90675 RepID=A0ABM0Y3P1_CAMSA|nr:PREDICTED: YDG domain-containing protein At5g47150-like [Camelina sativa]XP_010494939.1 PREDICTED: YDG domain-containing protein At5g47150-like [Camelina sativa]XP_010494940.1 PREDICTED: YDG domain-containing protein At5g47150-like [Camelina sativa]